MVAPLPPWFPRSPRGCPAPPPNPPARGGARGVGTGALPLQILMNDLDLLYKHQFLCIGASFPRSVIGGIELGESSSTT